MIIEANGVACVYKMKRGSVRAVDNVNYRFENGTFYTIMGKSGSGKTTLLSMIAGLILPTSGTIKINGEDTAAIDRNRLRRESVSVIYQDFNLFPLLTVLENTAYPLVIRKTPKADADGSARARLLQVGITEEQMKRLPNMLSGGEQQRVAIARALTSGSEIILADEPTGNLDSENSENVVEILRRLAHEEDKCVIVVTHDPAVAEKADVVLRMRDGELAESEQGS